MRTTARSTPLSCSTSSPSTSRDGLAHRYRAPLDRAVIRSVSDVDSNRMVGSDTHHSYRKRRSVAETAVPGLGVRQAGGRDKPDEYGGEDDQGQHRWAFHFVVTHTCNCEECT